MFVSYSLQTEKVGDLTVIIEVLYSLSFSSYFAQRLEKLSNGRQSVFYSLVLASLRSRDADVDDAVKNGCCAHLWTCHAIFTASSTSALRDLKLAIISLL